MNLRNVTNNFYSQYHFIHDIGGHPPVIPYVSDNQINNNHESNSYEQTVNISLAKVKDIIRYLEDTGEINNTNIVITGDHTESYDFSKNRYNLYPKRINVPLYFRPSIELRDSPLINSIKKDNNILPTTFILSKIFSKLFNVELNHPDFFFNNLFWISSVYKYPKNEYINNLAFDKETSKYYCCIINSKTVKKYESKSFSNIKLEIYKLDYSDQLIKVMEGTTIFKRIKCSFINYLISSRKKGDYPIRQSEYN